MVQVARNRIASKQQLFLMFLQEMFMGDRWEYPSANEPMSTFHIGGSNLICS
jgi:hypothetical protein